jgi:hypothetical protein
MANYYESARTNYFQVKDIDAFKEELKDVKSLDIIVEHRNLKDYVCLLADSENGFAWDYYDEAQEDYVEIDWDGIFTKHLVDGSVAIIIGAGAEKLRYVSGYAFAFNNKGETKRIALDDIYKLAESLGSDVQRAEY